MAEGAGLAPGCLRTAKSDAWVLVSGNARFSLVIGGAEIPGESFDHYGRDTGLRVFKVKAGDRWLIRPEAGFLGKMRVVEC